MKFLVFSRKEQKNRAYVQIWRREGNEKAYMERKLIYYHSREELAAEPCTATGADGLFDDGDANRRVFAELVSAREAGGASADDDDVGIGVGDHVGHVAAGHFPGDDGFLDGVEFELVQIVGELRGGGGDGERCGGGGGGGFEAERMRRGQRSAMERGVKK